MSLVLIGLQVPGAKPLERAVVGRGGQSGPKLATPTFAEQPDLTSVVVDVEAGFRDISATPVPHKDHLPWNIDWIMLEARKQPNGA